MSWKFNDNPNNQKVYNYIKKITNSSEKAFSITRFIDLREYLDNNTFENAEHLRKEIPLFCRSESEQIFKLINEKKDIFTEWSEYLYEWQPSFLGDNEMTPELCIKKAIELGGEDMLKISIDSVRNSSIKIDLEKVDFLDNPSYGNVIAWLISSVFVTLTMFSTTTEDHFGQVFLISYSTIPLINLVLCEDKKDKETLIKLYGPETEQIKGLSSHIHSIPKCRTRRRLRV
jgi:hypothetical protein